MLEKRKAQPNLSALYRAAAEAASDAPLSIERRKQEPRRSANQVQPRLA
jgi:hypothetical protein